MPRHPAPHRQRLLPTRLTVRADAVPAPLPARHRRPSAALLAGRPVCHPGYARTPRRARAYGSARGESPPAETASGIPPVRRRTSLLGQDGGGRFGLGGAPRVAGGARLAPAPRARVAADGSADQVAVRGRPDTRSSQVPPASPPRHSVHASL